MSFVNCSSIQLYCGYGISSKDQNHLYDYLLEMGMTRPQRHLNLVKLHYIKFVVLEARIVKLFLFL